MAGADWLSYSLQDFVMFGPQVFLRLFVRINQDLWPWPVLAGLIGFVLPLLLLHHRDRVRQTGLGLIALAWMTSGYGFLVGYFGPINWPAEGVGWAFVVQGVLLGLIAACGGFHPRQPHRVLFATVWVLAVLGLPWVTVAESGDWRALAVFGLAPGTTAAAGSLALVFIKSPWRWVCLPVPLLWVIFSAASFWGLQSFWLLVLPAATLMASGLALSLSPSPARSRD